ncbi:MAG: HAD family hydrolase [Candidatus Nanopelagicales bacterium]|nr:HAD family hydrolase [Candidatus Nanopelagicales bacterium]MDZ4248917.1 HAD family hydrolase [Candidatus Nanopelagicales bacterium]
MTPARCVLATDLDGTLLRPDRSVSAATREGLSAAEARGVRIVFVTGRPPRWMDAVVEATGHVGHAICANGAVIVDLRAGLITRCSPIPADVAREVLVALRECLGPDAAFAVEQADLGPLSNSILRRERTFNPEAKHNVRRVGSFDELIEGSPIVKLLVRLPGGAHEADRLAAEVASHVGHLVEGTHSTRSQLLLEFGPGGVTKATALAEMTAGWGMTSADVLAVGDMPNDLPMLLWAGRAVAVRSAHPVVKAAVPTLIPDPEDDGVLSVLRRM